jgi:hypothetical protein
MPEIIQIAVQLQISLLIVTHIHQVRRFLCVTSVSSKPKAALGKKHTALETYQNKNERKFIPHIQMIF